MNNNASLETIKFYEKALIPLLKAKNAEMSILISELESHILLKNNKIQELEKKIKDLEKKAFFSESSSSVQKIMPIINETTDIQPKKWRKKGV
jgi:cell division protein FtsL